MPSAVVDAARFVSSSSHPNSSLHLSYPRPFAAPKRLPCRQSSLNPRPKAFERLPRSRRCRSFARIRNRRRFLPVRSTSMGRMDWYPYFEVLRRVDFSPHVLFSRCCSGRKRGGNNARTTGDAKDGGEEHYYYRGVFFVRVPSTQSEMMMMILIRTIFFFFYVDFSSSFFRSQQTTLRSKYFYAQQHHFLPLLVCASR